MIRGSRSELAATLLQLFAIACVGDAIADVADESLTQSYARFCARLVAVRDEPKR